MGIEIIAIILFILFTIEIVYIFMYSGNNNPVQQNITSGGINLPPLPPPSSNLGVRTIRTNRPYVFDSDFDNGGIIRSDIDGRRRRHRHRDMNNKHQHLTNIDFLVGDNKNTVKTIQSQPRFDFEDDDNDYKINLKNENPNQKLFIKFHIHKHSNRDHHRGDHHHRDHHRRDHHRNHHHRNKDKDNNFTIRYRIKNENNKNILDDLDLSGKFNYDNNNQILTIGKIKNISKISDKINIKIDLD